MAEWLKAHAWKVCIRAIVSWVRIPLSPPFFEYLKLNMLKNNYSEVSCSSLQVQTPKTNLEIDLLVRL